MSVLTHDPCQVVWDALQDAGCDPRGDIWKASAKCPAHEDRSPSLAVGVGADGRALLWCGRGCDVKEIVRALGLRMAELFPPGHRSARRPAVLARHQPSP